MTSMTTLCKTLSAEVGARRAVAALRATGVPAHDLRLLTGRRLGDIRQDPVDVSRSDAGPDRAPADAGHRPERASSGRLRRRLLSWLPGTP